MRCPRGIPQGSRLTITSFRIRITHLSLARSFPTQNIGFATLGAARSRAPGPSYVQYVSKYIFELLGMTHTAFEVVPQIAPHLNFSMQARHAFSERISDIAV